MNSTVELPLTLDAVRALAAQAVAEKGRDFVYNPGTDPSNCSYLSIKDALAEGYSISCFGLDEDDIDALQLGLKKDPRWDTPCLAGRVLDAAGVTAHHEVPFETGIQVFLDSVNAHEILVGGAHGAAADYLVVLQNCQDKGESWGWAYDEAEGSVQRLGDSANEE